MTLISSPSDLTGDAHGRESQDIMSSLQDLIGILAEFGKREEIQFVMVGQRLGAFSQQARSISRSSESVVEAFVSGEGEGICGSLLNLIDRFEERVSDLLMAARSKEHSLKEVATHIDRIGAPLHAMTKVVKILYSLSFSTKVESCHDTSLTTLSSLAADLKRLAVGIDGKVDAISDQLKEMLLLVNGAEEKTVQLVNVSLPGTLETLRHCRRTVTELQGDREASLDAARQIQDSTTCINGALSEIISSVQFHDITRQQVDHVQAALRQYGQSTSHTAVSLTLHDLCRVQSAQLRHTRQELSSAVDGIITNLHRISPAVQLIAQQTRTLAASTRSAGETIFAEIEPVLMKVTERIVAADEEDHQASAAVVALLDGLKILNQLLQDVESIGVEMKLIAFNAGITAAHNYSRGAGLGVIAQTIQSLSRDLSHRSEEFSTIYGVMERLAMQFEVDDLSSRQGESLVETELMPKAEALLDDLRSISRQTSRLLLQMDSDSSALAREVVATASAITIHRDAGVLIDKVVDALQALSLRSEAEVQAPDTMRSLDLLAQNYTMQSERQVHRESSLGYLEAESSPQLPGHAGRDTTGLGENVELF